MATSTRTTLPNEVKTHYLMRLLMRAYPRLVHGRFAQKATLPKRAGDKLEYRKFSALTDVTAPLNESAFGYGGTVPAPQNVAQTRIEAQVNEYGAYIEYSDDVEMQSIDPVVENYSDLLGEQAGKSIDTITRSAIVAGANVFLYGGNATSAATLQQGDVMSFGLFAECLGTLMGNEARTIEGDKYPVVMHPHTWVDMVQDEVVHKAFDNAGRTGGRDPFNTGYIGDLLQGKIYVTSRAYVANDAGANGDGDSYHTYFFGADAYGTFGVEGMTASDAQFNGEASAPGNLTGEKIRTINLIVKEIGSAGTKDPMDEIGTVSWKISHGATVLDSNWIVCAVHTCSLGAQPT